MLSCLSFTCLLLCHYCLRPLQTPIGLADISLQAEFQETELLGKQEMKLEAQFDAVTCMFAIHYFFASKPALDNFFHNVNINLKQGEGLYRFANAPAKDFTSKVSLSAILMEVLPSG